MNLCRSSNVLLRWYLLHVSKVHPRKFQIYIDYYILLGCTITFIFEQLFFQFQQTPIKVKK